LNSAVVNIPFHHPKDGIIVVHLSLHSIDFSIDFAVECFFPSR
jgi:hypothetical protein